jgi:hypothetical protein
VVAAANSEATVGPVAAEIEGAVKEEREAETEEKLAVAWATAPLGGVRDRPRDTLHSERNLARRAKLCQR